MYLLKNVRHLGVGGRRGATGRVDTGVTHLKMKTHALVLLGRKTSRTRASTELKNTLAYNVSKWKSLQLCFSSALPAYYPERSNFIRKHEFSFTLLPPENNSFASSLSLLKLREKNGLPQTQVDARSLAEEEEGETIVVPLVVADDLSGLW
ncbi:hypothetical protein RUM43_000454 [Polyplax serrata]|uniref:Uncharacterized protein n=1 Tax=Polyplax serrata TaxID=468196 RepID=A0AAN8XSB1_POLSC